MAYLIGVFTGYTGSDHMTSGHWFHLWIIKVDLGISPRVLTIEQSDVLDTVQWNSHSNLEGDTRSEIHYNGPEWENAALDL